MTRLSDSRRFIGGAISTAASPLRNSFIDISCRSPVTPRRASRPPTQDGNNKQTRTLSINTEQARTYKSSTYLTTQQFSPRSPSKTPIYNSYHHANSNVSASSTLINSSPIANFFPATPQYNPLSSDGKLGTFSAINIILGKTVGVGIYSIPSSIFNSVGSVGAALLLWIIGSLISFCGLAVYLDLGTGIPRSGGERVYLERIFKKPRMLATCMFMAYVVLLGFSTPNCIVLGEYVMFALEIDANRWNVRAVGVAVITLLCFIHARYQKVGLRIINVLGVGKMLILVVVILSGIAGALMGVGSSTSSLIRRRLSDSLSIDEPISHLSTAQINFSSLFAGSSTQPYDYATALLKILYCFRGYSTANQVLSEVRNPIRTLRIAAPIALSLVSAGYVFANIAYFLVVSKEDFRTSGVVIAGHFFKNIFGEVVGENVLPLFIIVSAFGNIAATSFAQARVNQELGRDGLLPLQNLWKREEGNTPIAGLGLHWLISVLVIAVPPPGEIYNFLVDIGGYPVSVISVAISLGLLYLQSSPKEHWSSPFKAKKFYTIVFAASNCLLLVLPWMKPREEKGRFPYFAYPATALAILGSGAVYWGLWFKVRPVLCGNTGKKSWIGARIDGETVPMMRYDRFSSENEEEIDESEASEGLLRQYEDDGTSVKKRAPCGCPAKHG